MVMRNGSALSGDNEMMEVNGGGGEEPSTSYPIRVDELDHWDEDWIMPFPSKDGVCIRKGEKFSDYYVSIVHGRLCWNTPHYFRFFMRKLARANSDR
jgi:hypothetical protein